MPPWYKHYLNAGEEGLSHFQEILNAILEDVENATIEELNVAHGAIYYKGHKKDKNSERSYRTISSCPFLSKALDLYIRDLYQEQWNDCQASTQYQGLGSNHDLASLLVTEVIQYSLHVSNQPVFLLALDAQSAFDRCLRQILICELYKAGMNDDALKLVDNRLKSRTTVYEWDRDLCGPAPDTTGFEQGAINSSDYYKLYNNEQITAANASKLGVSLGGNTCGNNGSNITGNIVISAIAQADDVILCANNIDCLRFLVTLTENYCQKYRVKLVASKTKLLGYATHRKRHELDHAKLVNPLTIDGHPVAFAEEVEHVGVVRNTAGNMPHIMNRIAAHKSGLSFALSAGLARGRHGNPAASLRVHELYGTAKLFSGLATLVLSRSEVSVVDTHYQRTITNLQRLHDKTPRCFVFLLAGCLPGEAVLHKKQLCLFMLVCHLPQDPLHAHAKNVLLYHKRKSNSWFQNIRSLCLLYKLDHPLKLLNSPPSKSAFKIQVKENITAYWENKFREEASKLSSLKYFANHNYSLTVPSLVWTTATTSSFESRKASLLARMASGRFRSEYLTRHWSSNRHGYCLADTCYQVQGTLQHMLLECPALAATRHRLWNMFLLKSVAFPALIHFLHELQQAPPEVFMQFLLDPSAFTEVLDIWKMCGQSAVDHVYYLTRTFVYYLYREKQLLLGFWTTDRMSTKRGNKTNKDPITRTNLVSNTNFVAGTSTLADEGYPVLVGSAEPPVAKSPQPVLASLSVAAAANEEPHSGDQQLLSAAVPHHSGQDHEEAVRPSVDFNQPNCDPAAQRCGAPVLPAGQARPCLDHGGSGAYAKRKTKKHIMTRERLLR